VGKRHIIEKKKTTSEVQPSFKEGKRGKNEKGVVRLKDPQCARLKENRGHGVIYGLKKNEHLSGVLQPKVSGKTGTG